MNIDLLNAAGQTFEQHLSDQHGDVLPIMEMSLHNLMDDSDMCLEDFLSRAEVVATTGCTVMISDFREYHRLAAYLCRYTDRPIGLAMGLATLRELFVDKYYDNLEGGLLEGFGRLFRNQLQLLVYPRATTNGKVEGLASLDLDESLQHLFDYLRGRGCIVPLEDVAYEHLHIHSHDVLDLIARGSDEWVQMVPDCVAKKIRTQRLFGYSA